MAGKQFPSHYPCGSLSFIYNKWTRNSGSKIGEREREMMAGLKTKT